MTQLTRSGMILVSAQHQVLVTEQLCEDRTLVWLFQTHMLNVTIMVRV